MLKWALIFAVIAIVAGLLGFGGIAGAAAGIAKFLAVLALIVFAVFLVLGFTVANKVTLNRDLDETENDKTAALWGRRFP